MEKVTVRVPNGNTNAGTYLLNGEPVRLSMLSLTLLPNEEPDLTIKLCMDELDFEIEAAPHFVLDDFVTQASAIKELNRTSYALATQRKNQRFGYDPRNSLA